MKNQEFDKEIMSVIMGETFQTILSLSDEMPIDSKQGIRKEITIYLLEVCKSIDTDKIKFNEDTDKAMLYGLMVIALQVFFDGREQKSDISVH